jgi:hypothetical protein
MNLPCPAKFTERTRCDLPNNHPGWHRAQLQTMIIRWRTLVTTEDEYLSRRAAHDEIRLP